MYILWCALSQESMFSVQNRHVWDRKKGLGSARDLSGIYGKFLKERKPVTNINFAKFESYVRLDDVFGPKRIHVLY